MPLLMTDVAAGSNAQRQLDVNALQKQYDPKRIQDENVKVHQEVETQALKLQVLKDNILETGVEKSTIQDFFSDPANVKSMQDNPIATMSKLVSKSAQATGKLDAVEKLAGVIGKMEEASSKSEAAKALAEVRKHEKNNNIIDSLPDTLPDTQEGRDQLKQDALAKGLSPEIVDIFQNELRSGKSMAEAKKSTLEKTQTHHERAELEKLRIADENAKRLEKKDDQRFQVSMAMQNRLIAATNSRSDRDAGKLAVDLYNRTTTDYREMVAEQGEIRKQLKDLGEPPKGGTFWNSSADNAKIKAYTDAKASLTRLDKQLEERKAETKELRARALKKISGEDRDMVDTRPLQDAPKSGEPKGKTGDGTEANPAKPTTQADYADLKDGAYYVDPKDGVTYQKKKKGK